jgi:hypothetical protein
VLYVRLSFSQGILRIFVGRGGRLSHNAYARQNQRKKQISDTHHSSAYSARCRRDMGTVIGFLHAPLAQTLLHCALVLYDDSSGANLIL